MQETLHCQIEIREVKDGPMLHGILIQEGRAASARAEVFAPGSLQWSAEGIALRAKHLGVEDSRAIPTRDSDGSIRIAAPASAAIVAAFNEGRRFLSIEFHALQETRSKSGVREIQSAFSSRRGPRFRSRICASDRRSPIQSQKGMAMKWPWQRPETRSSDYTNQIINSLMAAASGGGDGRGLAVVEVASRLWGAHWPVPVSLRAHPHWPVSGRLFWIGLVGS